MILFDTDHLSVLTFKEDSHFAAVAARMLSSNDTAFAACAVTLEEQLKGWLAKISGERVVRRQIQAYARLVKLVEFYSDWQVLPFDERAADIFESLRSQRIRIGTLDLKIASIALANNAVVVTANRIDFERVPALTIENWMAS